MWQSFELMDIDFSFAQLIPYGRMAQQDEDEKACPSQYPRDHQSTQETKLQARLN